MLRALFCLAAALSLAFLTAASAPRFALPVAQLDGRGAKPSDQPGEAAEYSMAQRRPPGEQNLPLQRLHDALNEIRVREAAHSNAHSGAASLPGGIQSWTALGPGNVGGRTRAIVIDPVNPDVMYASGVAGGVWKSTDGGGSWNALDDDMLNLAVCALVIDPVNPDVIYAGTGEGYFRSDNFLQGLGIFKSVDAGATWTQLAGTVSGVPAGAFYYVNKIRISPNDSNRLYAATRFGVWRSLDAGVTWAPVLTNPRYYTSAGVQESQGSSVGCTDLALRTDSNPDVLWAAFGSLEADGLFRSNDGGNSWIRYATPSCQGRMTIANRAERQQSRLPDDVGQRRPDICPGHEREAPGVYFVRLRSGIQVTVRKILKAP